MPLPDNLTPAPPARHLPAGLLRRYVAGELSAAQEHAVEAHTLECEQCAEVLEGLEMQPAAVTDASVHELRQRLHARVAELATENTPAPALVPMWWRPLAAAAMLLLTLGAVVWLVLRPTARPEIAVRSAPAVETVRPANTPATGFDGAGAPTESAELAAPKPTADVAAVAPPTRPADPLRTPPMRSSSDALLASEPVAAEMATADATESKVLAGPKAAGNAAEDNADAASASYAATAAAPATNQLAKTRRAGKLSEAAQTLRAAGVAAAPAAGSATEDIRTVRGRVVDSNGQPVPGATVTIHGASNGLSTNLDGSFEINISKSISEISVSSLGYRTLTHVLPPSDSALILTLGPNRKAPSEVMVRREAPPGLPSLGPLPAGGYAAFQQYLRDSLDYPIEARTKRLEGYVRLQFVVGVDGKLTDIKVVSKLSPECDEEAIRLLKEGPAWFSGVQNNRRTARKVELKVPFFLEKR